MTCRRAILLVCLCILGSALARGQEPPETTPSPRSSRAIDRAQYDERCLRDCTSFRKECNTYCKSQGLVPASRVRSNDCKNDCEDFEEQCLYQCQYRVPLRLPPLEY